MNFRQEFKKQKRGLGIFLIIAGILISASNMIMTGSVIGLQPQNYISIFGIIVFVLGIVTILIDSLEERAAHNAAVYDRLKKDLRKRERKARYDGFSKDARSVKEAVTARKDPYEIVPLEEARRIYEESNRNVKSGKWVELLKTGTTKATNKYWSPGISEVRYWGPNSYTREKWRERESKRLKGLSESKVNKMYEKFVIESYDNEMGILGKTHEVTQSIEDYPSKTDFWKKIIPWGRVPRHRHWEINQMYRRSKDYKSSKREYSRHKTRIIF